MVKLHRTASDNPQAVIQVADQVLVTAWSGLLELRKLVKVVPAEAASTYYPHQEQGAWVASGSPSGIELIAPSGETLLFGVEEWGELARLLYVGDVLLTLKDVAEISGKVQSHVSTSVASGRLFAFQIPGRKARQWQVPHSAAEEWANSTLVLFTTIRLTG